MTFLTDPSKDPSPETSAAVPVLPHVEEVPVTTLLLVGAEASAC